MPQFIPEILAVQLQNGILTEGCAAGYLVAPAPRRAARGRTGEVFLSILDVHNRAALPESEIDRLAALMARVFFETPGSVTAALRAAFVAANAEVLPFGQIPASSVPGTGLIQLNAICAVIRESDIFFVYAGDVLTLIIRESGVEQYPPPGDAPARALGMTLNVDFRYGRSALTGPATLILAASPAPTWSSSIPTGLTRLSLRAVGDRMAQQSASRADSFGAFIIRFAEAFVPEKSSSFMDRIRRHPQEENRPGSMAGSPTPGMRYAGDAGRRKGSIVADAQLPSTPATLSHGQSAPVQEASLHVAGDENRLAAPSQKIPLPVQSTAPKPGPQKNAGSEPHAPRPEVGRIAASLGRSIRAAADSVSSTFRRFVARLLPQGVLQRNDQLSLSPPVMLGMAIAIPLVVVSVVAVIYFRKGRDMEFGRLMQEAQVEAAVARAQTDPLSAREAWQQTFDLLKTASDYGVSDAFTTLQNQAAHMLDSIDRIEPLEFQLAVAGELDTGTRITAMIVEDRIIYALDSGHNRILQLLPGQGGYQVSADFICQAGEYPDITVGPLLDLAWVSNLTIGSNQPASPRDGVVVAIDSEGVLLYCPPGGMAVAGALPVPRTGWSSPAVIEYYSGRLYVLDPGVNGFWRYAVSDSDGFNKSPSDYFSVDHPSVADAVDFAVASGEVFFLHADGHVTRCLYDPLLEAGAGDISGGTQCEEMPFNDTRPGQTPGPRIKDAMLSRIFYNDYPEPTLFFLDPLGRGAFRFSLMLNFLSRYRVTIAPENQEATALAMGNDKVLYLAIGPQIYYARPSTP